MLIPLSLSFFGMTVGLVKCVSQRVKERYPWGGALVGTGIAENKAVNQPLSIEEASVITIDNLSFAICYLTARYLPGDECQYDWSSEQVEKQVKQLIAAFMREYDSQGEGKLEEKYSSFRIGAISLKAEEDDRVFLDGHQLFITLALLLICIHNWHGDRPNRNGLEYFLFFGELNECHLNTFHPYGHYMKGMIQGVYKKGRQAFTPVCNLVSRYRNIQGCLQEVGEQALPFFSHWLLHHAHLEVITAECDEDARVLQRLRQVYGS